MTFFLLLFVTDFWSGFTRFSDGGGVGVRGESKFKSVRSSSKSFSGIGVCNCSSSGGIMISLHPNA